eukprot:5880736-Amphidinium_carterae.1
MHSNETELVADKAQQQKSDRNNFHLKRSALSNRSDLLTVLHDSQHDFALVKLIEMNSATSWGAR